MRAGFTVVLAGRRIELLEETRSLGPEPGMSTSVVCDIADPESIASLFAKVMDLHGRLDLLFNNAGIFPQGAAIDELNFDAWKKANGPIVRQP